MGYGGVLVSINNILFIDSLPTGQGASPGVGLERALEVGVVRSFSLQGRKGGFFYFEELVLHVLALLPSMV